MISKKQAIEILNAGLSTGADYAEIFIEDKETENIVIENGKVDQSTIVHTYGAGIRLLNKLQSVYGYTNDVTKKGLLELANNLASSFNGKQELTVSNLKIKKVKDMHHRERLSKDVNPSEKINYLLDGDKVMHEFDKRIVRTKESFSNTYSKVTLINSKGFIFKDEKERSRVALICIAAEEDKIETGFMGPGTSGGFEYFLKNIDIKKLAHKAAKQAITMLTAKECPSGRMTVVIGNGDGGVIFHEACGHALEASSVSKNLSVFANKLGQQIASPIVNAIDDGTIINEWGSNNIDDEGNKTQKTQLIKNGILTSYLIDDFNGRRMNAKGNGACRRQSYKFEPTSRMANTYICPGKSTPEEIIAATKLGLYAASLSGGSVNPTTGEFNFGCSEAYIIRDGKICEPVRGASLIGSGAEVLMNIDMIGNDLEMSQGLCGAASGSIPVDIGQPTIRVQNILVGGNGGQLK